jgi:hypothetical protein
VHRCRTVAHTICTMHCGELSHDWKNLHPPFAITVRLSTTRPQHSPALLLYTPPCASAGAQDGH